MYGKTARFHWSAEVVPRHFHTDIQDSFQVCRLINPFCSPSAMRCQRFMIAKSGKSNSPLILFAPSAFSIRYRIFFLEPYSLT